MAPGCPRASHARSRRDDEEDDAEEQLEAVTPPGFDLNLLVAQLVPMLMTNILSGKMKVPSLAALFDWRKAKPANDGGSAPASEATAPSVKPKAKPALAEAAAPTHEEAQDAALPPRDPAAMVHKDPARRDPRRTPRIRDRVVRRARAEAGRVAR